jgi:hypothetical protein
VLTFVAYRRFRKLWLWEPLVAPPRLERRAALTAFERPPAGERIKVHRKHAAAMAPVEAEEPVDTTVARGEEKSRRRVAVWAMVATVVSLVALYVDLSPFDPFGPGLGWSPGVLLMVWVSVYLLARGRSET